MSRIYLTLRLMCRTTLDSPIFCVLEQQIEA